MPEKKTEPEFTPAPREFIKKVDSAIEEMKAYQMGLSESDDKETIQEHITYFTDKLKKRSYEQGDSETDLKVLMMAFESIKQTFKFEWKVKKLQKQQNEWKIKNLFLKN